LKGEAKKLTHTEEEEKKVSSDKKCPTPPPLSICQATCWPQSKHITKVNNGKRQSEAIHLIPEFFSALKNCTKKCLTFLLDMQELDK
jgi:hypothetical protein